MSDFWDHLINAAGHLLDAKKQAEAERAAESEARRQARRTRPASPRHDAPVSSGAAPEFSGEKAGADCCITKRRVKV